MAAPTAPPALRDALITAFRHFLCEKIGFIPFEHQAAWWAATDGDLLTDIPPRSADRTIQVRLPDTTLVTRTLTPRPQGRAKVVAELGAYKSGKSAGAGAAPILPSFLSQKGRASLKRRPTMASFSSPSGASSLRSRPAARPASMSS